MHIVLMEKLNIQVIKMMHVKLNENEIFTKFRMVLKAFHERDADDIIPHMVMSHLFMEWISLLYRTVPSLLSNAKLDKSATDEQKEQARYEQYRHVARTFFKDVDFLTVDEKAQFTVDGWQAFLDD